MSLNKKRLLSSCAYTYVEKDITVILCIRVMDENEWLLERIASHKHWYDPEPNYLIIDYGSDDIFQKKIQQICLDNEYEYHYVENNDVFSLSEARNTGFSKSSTELLFFTDPDFVMERDSFPRMLKIVNGNDFSTNKLVRITMPAYHVIEGESKHFEMTDIKGKENIITQWGFYGPYAEHKKVFDFVAPYSNNFLCHRDFYDLSGGYSMDFRGHGSEDFEFMVRGNILFGKMPMPENLSEDKYKPFPFRDDYYDWKKYSGFRRLAESEAFIGESFGLRAFHIWHPLTVKGWHEVNDGKRITFNKVLSRYLGNELNLLKEDYLPRSKSALCLSHDVSETGYFLPLRLLGYKLDVLNTDDITENDESISRVAKNKYDAIFVVSPSNNSEFRSLIKQYVQKGKKVFVLQKGIVPNSIFFKDLSGSKANIFQSELIHPDRDSSDLEEYLLYLKDTFDEDKHLLASIEKETRTTVFISIDESTVLFWDEKEEKKFDLFIQELLETIDDQHLVAFVFERKTFEYLGSFLGINNLPNNCHIIDDSVDCSSVINAVDAVVSYQKEEGLIGLFLGKPVYVVNQCDVGYPVEYVSGVREALELYKLCSTGKKVSKKNMALFFNWLVLKKYSFYSKSENIWAGQRSINSDFQRIKYSTFNFNDQRKLISFDRPKFNYDKSSYIASRRGLYGEEVEQSKLNNLLDSLEQKNKESQEKVESNYKAIIASLEKDNSKLEQMHNDILEQISIHEKKLESQSGEIKALESKNIKNQEKANLLYRSLENKHNILKQENKELISNTKEQLLVLEREKDDALEKALQANNSLQVLIQEKADNISLLQRLGVLTFGLLFRAFILPRQRAKLQKQPRAFFRDSKSSFTQAVGRLLKIL